MGEKTTIEIDNLRELKQHALDTNKTLRQLINEAISEKIERERGNSVRGSGISSYTVEPVNVIEQKHTAKQYNIDELKKLLTNAGLLTIVEKECQRHHLQLNDLTTETVTESLVSDIHIAIKLVFDDGTANQIIQKIESVFK